MAKRKVAKAKKQTARTTKAKKQPAAKMQRLTEEQQLELSDAINAKRKEKQRKRELTEEKKLLAPNAAGVYEVSDDGSFHVATRRNYIVHQLLGADIHDIGAVIMEACFMAEQIIVGLMHEKDYANNPLYRNARDLQKAIGQTWNSEGPIEATIARKIEAAFCAGIAYQKILLHPAEDLAKAKAKARSDLKTAQKSDRPKARKADPQEVAQRVDQILASYERDKIKRGIGSARDEAADEFSIDFATVKRHHLKHGRAYQK